jgi:Calcineurin-like phosphoesterase
VLDRRRRLANRGITLETAPYQASKKFGWQSKEENPYTPRISDTIKDGYVVCFSDAHFWPGIRSTAFEALIRVIKHLKPKIVVSNGDALDGASISRHDPLGWQSLPRVIDELDATKGFLGEVERAAGNAKLIFTVGNHDSRYDRRLASEISEFEEVPGMRLSDHLKSWRFCYGFLLNEHIDPVFFIHTIRGGVHAPRNNALAAGCTVFTGHLHSQKVMPVSTLLRDFDGVDAGMIADRDGVQFSYVAAKPTDWREGFAVQRFDKNGYRYPPELCRVQHINGKRRAVFRGEVVYER